MSLNEFELINRYFKRQPKHSSVIEGVGDDCAIVSVNSNHHLVISMDTLVEGCHFPEFASAYDIATRAFCSSLSDLAAMGATPQWFTLALSLPSVDETWINQFSQGLFAVATEFDCDLIGGDTTRGPLTITIQVHGVVEKGSALARNGATAGDTVFVSGSLGDGAAALDIILNDSKASVLTAGQIGYLRQHFYRPQAQIEIGKKILPFANCAIDVSDGLLADLGHIAKASKIDIEIDIDALPISSACKNLTKDKIKSLNFALTGGDDYQIAFSVPSQSLEDLMVLINNNKMPIKKIGKVVDSMSSVPEVRCYQGQKLFTLNLKEGYQHFAS